MDKISLIKQAIEKANKLQSDLPTSQYEVPALTSLRIRHLLNNLGKLGTHYLEIGVHKGGTFTATIAGNRNLKTITAIDSFESDHMNGEVAEKEFNENANKFNPLGTIQNVIIADSFQVHLEDISQKVDLYLYDGGHSEDDQRRALTYYLPVLANEFIFLCDDYDWPEVQKGTQDGIIEAGLEILFDKHIPSAGSHDNDSYWNGFYIALLKKK